MCGRYSLALRPSLVRAYLQDDDMPVYEAPEDDADDTPRQSYNFAPGYNGLVYRADVPYYGAGPRSQKNDEAEEGATSTETQDELEEQEQGEVRYKLQSMKWGLIPFWTKRNPDYGSMLKTINCRDDSLIDNKGMWTTMKQKKRCIVIAQGIYEWLSKGPKDKVPHYIKRKDGKLMCMAGLWDCVQYEGSEEKTWTYTVITTSSNAQMRFLHDRMPVILENGSKEMRSWLDPRRLTWSKNLQSLLKPFKGELEIYAVSKDVGKVGNNSPSFIIPVASAQNKSNIANFFAKGTAKMELNNSASLAASKRAASRNEDMKDEKSTSIKSEAVEDCQTIDQEGTEDNAPSTIPKLEAKPGIKRELDDVDEEPLKKTPRTSKSKGATSNKTASPKKTLVKEKGSQKITSFFNK